MKPSFILIFPFLILLIANQALAQSSQSRGPVALTSTESFVFKTETTQDDFLIEISLPPNFDRSGNIEYSVIYLTDANGRFALFREIYGTLLRDRQIPPMIIVGIGYELEKPMDVIAKRSRDMTPVRSLAEERQREAQGLPGITGDGPKFMKFITEELIPYIDTVYPANDTRIYAGFSLGGLFGLSVLFDTQNIFSHYIIGSPSLWYSADGYGENGNIMTSYMFEHESDYAAYNSDLNANVFFSVGTKEGESMLPNLVLFHSRLAGRDYSGLTLGIRIFEGESHNTSPIGAYFEGLKFVAASLGQ